jgi:hypothetical protein
MKSLEQNMHEFSYFVSTFVIKGFWRCFQSVEKHVFRLTRFLEILMENRFVKVFERDSIGIEGYPIGIDLKACS